MSLSIALLLLFLGCAVFLSNQSKAKESFSYHPSVRKLDVSFISNTLVHLRSKTLHIKAPAVVHRRQMHLEAYRRLAPAIVQSPSLPSSWDGDGSPGVQSS